MRRNWLAVVVFLALIGTAYAQVPVTGAGKVTLKQIEGTPTLITVVLKPSGAKDTNLRLAKVGKDYIEVLTQDGERVTYLFSSIAEISVQNGTVETRKIVPISTHMLNQDERLIVSSAWRQAKTLFDSSNDNQPVKMDAASLLALVKDDELDPDAIQYQKQASDYLRAFLTGDDLQIALDAATRLYLAGEDDFNMDLISRALTSGNRDLRISGAQLAGLMKVKSAEPTLFEQRKHRTAEIAAAATLALARIGATLDPTELTQEISDIREEKANAAMFALITIGGDAVKEACKDALTKVQGVGPDWMRLVKVLYALDDPYAMRLLKEQGMENAVIKREAAIMLARRGDWDAIQWVRDQLDAKVDQDLLNLTYRVRFLCALYEAGQPFAVTQMQQLFSLDPALVVAPGLTDQARQQVVQQVSVYLLRQIAEIGDRKLLTVIQPTIQSQDRFIALEACEAAFAIANEDYHDRLSEYRENP